MNRQSLKALITVSCVIILGLSGRAAASTATESKGSFYKKTKKFCPKKFKEGQEMGVTSTSQLILPKKVVAHAANAKGEILDGTVTWKQIARPTEKGTNMQPLVLTQKEKFARFNKQTFNLECEFIGKVNGQSIKVDIFREPSPETQKKYKEAVNKYMEQEKSAYISTHGSDNGYVFNIANIPDTIFTD